MIAKTVIKANMITDLHPNPCWLFLTDTSVISHGTVARMAVDMVTGERINPDWFWNNQWDELKAELA